MGCYHIIAADHMVCVVKTLLGCLVHFFLKRLTAELKILWTRDWKSKRSLFFIDIIIPTTENYHSSNSIGVCSWSGRWVSVTRFTIKTWYTTPPWSDGRVEENPAMLGPQRNTSSVAHRPKTAPSCIE